MSRCALAILAVVAVGCGGGSGGDGGILATSTQLVLEVDGTCGATLNYFIDRAPAYEGTQDVGLPWSVTLTGSPGQVVDLFACSTCGPATTTRTLNARIRWKGAIVAQDSATGTIDPAMLCGPNLRVTATLQ